MNKKYILKKSYDIEELVKLRNSVGSKYYVLYYKKTNDLEDTKITISASKKLGNAVTRNYNKRVTKEILREKISFFKGFKILMVIKATSLNLSYKEKQEQVDYIINKFNKEKKNEEK